MGMTVMDAEQGRKLKLMRDSAMAHPAARWMLEAPGHCEASMYWNDDETAELCRIRPDKWLNEHNVIVDVKKVADMDRFARHIEEFRYHVQDAMYREGALKVTGHPHSTATGYHLHALQFLWPESHAILLADEPASCCHQAGRAPGIR